MLVAAGLDERDHRRARRIRLAARIRKPCALATHPAQETAADRARKPFPGQRGKLLSPHRLGRTQQGLFLSRIAQAVGERRVAAPPTRTVSRKPASPHRRHAARAMASDGRPVPLAARRRERSHRQRLCCPRGARSNPLNATATIRPVPRPASAMRWSNRAHRDILSGFARQATPKSERLRQGVVRRQLRGQAQLRGTSGPTSSTASDLRCIGQYAAASLMTAACNHSTCSTCQPRR